MIARGRVATRRHEALFSTIAIVALLSATTGAFADDDGYSSADYNACLDCHENSGVLGIKETKHFDFEDSKSPAAQKQCQSCHGPSARHMEFPMQVENVHFGKGSTAAPAVQNQMCLECHDAGERANWDVSPHGFEHVLCNNCHSIHQPERIVPSRARTTAKCTEACHDDLLAGAEPADFTHPVPMKPTDEDDFTCATCHNPHGGLESTRCGDCHEQTSEELAKQSPKAQRFHATASKKDIDCIRCHKGLAHPIKPLAELDDAELEALISQP